jgi:hypothetical protein
MPLEAEALIPDREVARRLGKSTRSFHRWDCEPAKAPRGWPKAVRLLGRKHRRSSEFAQFLDGLSDGH